MLVPSTPFSPSSPVILNGTLHSPIGLPLISNVFSEIHLYFNSPSEASVDHTLPSTDCILVTTLDVIFHTPPYGFCGTSVVSVVV